MIKEESNKKEETDKNANLSLEVLRNKQILKEIFLKTEKKYLTSEIHEFTEFLEGGHENRMSMWYNTNLRRYKENVLFNNLSSELMKNLIKSGGNMAHFTTNINYYKQYLKIYSNFYSRNFEHLQILRMNYILSRIKGETVNEQNIEKKNDLVRESELAAMYQTYITSDEIENLKGDSPTYVITMLTSTLSMFHSDSVKDSVILRCLDNLVMEFKNSLNKSEQGGLADKISFEIVAAIEENIIMLIDFVTTRIFNDHDKYSYNFKNEIFKRFINILEFFKSQNLLVKLLFLLKEFKFSISNLHVINKIFEIENDCLKLLTNQSGEISELDSLLDTKNQIDLKSLNLNESINNPKEIKFLLTLADEKYYYVFLNNFVLKLGQGNEDTILNQIYDSLQFTDQKNNQEKMTQLNIIMKENFLYVLVSRELSFDFIIVEKNTFKIITEYSISLEGRSLKSTFNDDDYFYLINEPSKGMTETVDTSLPHNPKIELVVNRIKAKNYKFEKIKLLVMNERSYKLQATKEDLEIMTKEKVNLTNQSLITNFLAQMCYCNNQSDSINFKIELFKESRIAILETHKYKKKNFKTYYSFYFNKYCNNMLLCYLNDSTLNFRVYKVFQINPYNFDYTSKHFIKQQITRKDIIEKFSEVESSQSLEVVKPFESNSNKSVSLQQLVKCINRKQIKSANLQVNESDSNEYYRLLLYKFANYILIKCNSKKFNYTINKSTPIKNIVKSYMAPFSFIADINISIIDSILYKVFILEKEDFLFDFEKVAYLIIMKNYLQNLQTLGVDIKAFLLLSCDKRDILNDLVNIFISMLKKIIVDTSSDKNIKKYMSLCFNEVLDIFSILIKQKYPLDTATFINLIQSCKDVEKQMKILTTFTNIISYCDNNSEFNIYNFLSFVLHFERNILFNLEFLDSIDKFSAQTSVFSMNFKSIFIKHFSKDLLVDSIEEGGTFYNLLKIFSTELEDVIKKLMEMSEEILHKDKRKAAFMDYVENYSLSFNFTFLLIQIFNTTFMSNKKSKTVEFPHMYLKYIINLFVKLEELSNNLRQQLNSLKEFDRAYYLETEHPLAHTSDRVIQFNIKEENKENTRTFINYDILCNSNSNAYVEIEYTDENKKSKVIKHSKNFPLERIDIHDNNVSIKAYMKKGVKASSNKQSDFFNEYGLKMEISQNEGNFTTDFINEIRRCILYSINAIIGENLTFLNDNYMEKEIRTVENLGTNSNIIKDKMIYKSVFNSKLLRYISLPDSEMLVKRENIKYINELINSINNDEIKNKIAKLFSDLSSDEINNESNLSLLPSYSMEISHHSSSTHENQINTIINSSDPIFEKGIKYLQKTLQMKNSYLANLGGHEIEPLVLHIFVIILKYQNLVTLYLEKYINEIFNLEHSTQTELKTEDLHKIPTLELFLKIWTECSKIRIWFLERKMILAEIHEKSKGEGADVDYDQEITHLIFNLTHKAKFFLSIISNHNNEDHSTDLNSSNLMSSYSQEIIESVMTCIKTDELSLEKITERIKAQNELGIKRETGLILLNIMLNLIGPNNETDLNDLVYNLNKVMKRENKIVSFIDDLIGADYKIIDRVKNQFHLLMENLVTRTIKVINNPLFSFITKISLVQSLIWKIKARDYSILKSLNIFEILKVNKNEIEGNTNNDLLIYGKDLVTSNLLSLVFGQLFEIYTLQIFRKASKFRSDSSITEIESKASTGSILSLKRSQSNVNEDESKLVIEFIINVMIECFQRCISNKNSNSNSKSILEAKSFLILLYRSIGYNTEIIQLIQSISPNLLVILLELFNMSENNLPIDVKYLLVKILHQYIMAIYKLDQDLINFSVRKFAKSLKQSLDDSDTSITPIRFLCEYFFDLISTLKQNINENNTSLVYELVDLFKNFFNYDSESHKNEITSLINEKLKNFDNLDTILFILDTSVNVLRVGSRVLVNINKKVPPTEFCLEESESNTINGNEYKIGRIIGFGNAKVNKNPFEVSEKTHEYLNPELIFNYNTKSNCPVYVILEESLMYSTIKNSSYEILNLDKLVLIKENRIQACQENITKFLIDNNIVQFVINNVLMHESIPIHRKYFTLKFVNNILESSDDSNLQIQLLNEINENPDIFKFFKKMSTLPFDTIVNEETNQKYKVNIKYLSLEYLEDVLKYDIISLKEKSNKKEFYENFSFCFPEGKKFIVTYGISSHEISVLLKYNETLLNSVPTYQTNKLSVYRKIPEQRVLHENSILYVSSEDLSTDEAKKDVIEIVVKYKIFCIVTDSSDAILKDFPRPVIVVSKYIFYSHISYFFFVKMDYYNEFNFHYADFIDLTEIQEKEKENENIKEANSNEQKVEKEEKENKPKENNENCEAMIYFPGVEEENEKNKITEDLFEKNRNPQLISSQIFKLNSHCIILLSKLCSLLSRRILLKLVTKNFRLPSILKYLNDEETSNIIKLIFKSISIDYMYNLNFPFLQFELETQRKMLTNLLLILDDSTLTGQSMFADIFNLNKLTCLAKDELHLKLLKSNLQEDEILNDPDYQSLEIKFKLIIFMLSHNFEKVNENMKTKFFSSFVNDITELENVIKTHPYISEILKDVIKLLYLKIMHEESNGRFITMLNENSLSIFPLDKINALISLCHNLTEDKIDEKKTIGKVETNICQFLFVYFDIILYVYFKYGVSLGIHNWISGTHKIFQLYYRYCVFTKKFDVNKKDFLSFLTLFLHNEGINKNIDIKNRTKEVEFKYKIPTTIPFLRKIVFPEVHELKASVHLPDEQENFISIYDKHHLLQEYFTTDDWPGNMYYNFNFGNQDIYMSNNFKDFKHSLYAFGKNDNHALVCKGQLSMTYGDPQLCIGLDPDVKVKAFKFGFHHTFVLDYNGTLYVAGKEQGSSLPSSTVGTLDEFTKSNLFNEIGSKEGGIKNIYVNNFNSSIILTNSNKLYGCGSNTSGNLSNAKESNFKTNQPFELAPLPIEDYSIPVKHVALGYKNTMVILEDGSAFTLGDNNYYQTGSKSSRSDVTEWFKLPLPDKCKKFVYAAAGELYFLILIEEDDGKIRLYSIGCNDQGRCGVGNDTSNNMQKCAEVDNLEFKYVSTRNYSSAAITTDGKLYTFGDNESGCLGLPNKGNQVRTPTLVDFFVDNNCIVDSVSIGNYHMIVLVRKLIDGQYIKKIYTCGLNSWGNLGSNNTSLPKQKVPMEVEFFTNNKLTPVRIFSSKYQSYVLTISNDFNDKLYKHTEYGDKCSKCDQVCNNKLATFELLQNSQMTTESLNVGSLKIICDKCEVRPSSILYTIVTPLSKENLPIIEEELIKQKDAICQLNLIQIDETNIEQYNMEEHAYKCSDCMKIISTKKSPIYISTENINLILCSVCLSDHSPLINYPQVFYTFNKCHLDKSHLTHLPFIEFSKSLYKVQQKENLIGKTIFITKESSEKLIYDIYNSDSTLKTVDIIKKITPQVLIEYSEVRNEIPLNGDTKIEIENIQSYLNEKCGQSQYALIRNILEISNSKTAFDIMNSILSIINDEIFRFITINQVSKDKSLLSSAIRENSNYISSKNRMKAFFDKLNPMTENVYYGDKTINFNRFKARKFYEKNVPDLNGEETLFGQMYRSFTSFDVKKFRCKKDNRLFTVELAGEGATDYGGPYRDVFHTACEELQSTCLDLFIKSPNNKSEVGAMRDKYVLNPSANFESHYMMYKFLGQLMGYAICSGNLLNLNIHPIIWKLLLGVDLKFSDLETVDKMFFKLLTDIEKTTENMTKPEEFEYMYDISFTILLSNCKELELISNGKNIPVTLTNKDKFLELAKSKRLDEFKNQIKHLKNGLYDVIPESLLQLLTWRELENLVCGKPSLDIAVLKSKTEYQSYSEDDNMIKWFWEVLESFKDEEKVLYLKYVWGRSRLPDPTMFNYTHIISKLTRSNPDKRFPEATTCYFTVKLPQYSSKELLAERLRYVVLNCNEIDADYSGGGFTV